MLPARTILILSAISALALIGCVTAEYAKPDQLGLNESQTSRVFDTDVDTVWQAIDTHSSLFFFSIEDLDRDSGHVSAKFSGDPSRYVDGGQITRPGEEIPEPYTVYLRQKNLQLSGKIDLDIVEVRDGKTRVRINAHYSVMIPGKSFINSFTGEVNKGKATTWFFDSNGHDTQKTSGASEGTGSPSRTFCPTGALESDVLDEIERILI